MWKKFIRDYLTFSRKDRIGIFVLVSLIAITLLAPLAFPYLKKERKPDTAKTQETIRQLREIFKDTSDIKTANATTDDISTVPEEIQLFYFDPNTTSLEQWLQLGVHKNVAVTIQKYLSKGGIFRKPEDLKKIYTLPKEDADRLIPYVRIKIDGGTPSALVKYNTPEPGSNENKSYSKKHFEIIDINKADTTAFIKLPGIGSKLAQRIVTFREKLGGFCSVEQVGETRFLPDSVFQKIRPLLSLKTMDTKKIDINAAGINELRSHPYIDYNVANAIIQFRNQYGPYKSLDDLKKIHIIDDILFGKIQPYLVVK